MNNIYFHEQAHIYFKNKQDLEAFDKSFQKNSKWAIKNKSRWNAITSVTQVIEKAFDKFQGTDFNYLITWSSRILDEPKLAEIIYDLQFLKSELDKNTIESQNEGNAIHEEVQAIFLGEQKDFKHLNKTTILKIQKYVKNNVKEIIAIEKPLISEAGNFAGKWDICYLDNNNEYVIVDIKTGSDLKGQKGFKTQIQLMFYKRLLMFYLKSQDKFFFENEIHLEGWELARNNQYNLRIFDLDFKSAKIESQLFDYIINLFEFKKNIDVIKKTWIKEFSKTRDIQIEEEEAKELSFQEKGMKGY